MKHNNETGAVTGASAHSSISVNSCRRLRQQVDQFKHILLFKYAVNLNGQEKILQSALTEAEALAWQTPYPHLVFPVLAEEKVKAARRWAARQDMLRGSNWTRVLAA